MDSFSKRHGYHKAAKAITIREDAPESLRFFIQETYYESGKNPSDARAIVCRILRVPPDKDNWSEYPNIHSEVEHLIETAEWYKVYDIIEALAKSVSPQKKQSFEAEINTFFVEEGVGWKIENGAILYRGDEEFESLVLQTDNVLEKAELPTARGEIKEAIRDISRRPEPEITGAVQHALVGLECVAREATGDKKATLGELIKKNPGIFPDASLESAVSKMYGFASNHGRHLQEGNPPGLEEAELLVGISASLASYLAKKLPAYNANNVAPMDDFSF